MANTTVFTTAGKGVITSSLVTNTAAKYCAIGTGTTTPVVGNTALQTEATTGTWAGYARNTATMTQQTTSVTNDTVQWAFTFTNPGTTAPYALTEFGNFDASTTGNICLHSVFDAINLQNGDTINGTLQLQFT